MNNYSNRIISVDFTSRDALIKLEKIDDLKKRNLFVINSENKIVGTITDGDIRRGLLNNLNLTDTVEKFMNRNFKYLTEFDQSTDKLTEYRNLDIQLVPLINSNFNIIKIIDTNETKSFIPACAVIMAGGRGERLRPYTDDTPKPMLKIGSKPIIEHNIDRLIKFGINKIYISVRYLSETIIDYFGDGKSKGISIEYVHETQPLGTIGALSMIENIAYENILLMNSDILTNIDFEEFFQSYKKSNSDMCIVSIPYSVNIPYAVLEIENNNIKSFKEKPTYTYYSNGGIYFINKRVLNILPHAEYFNATDLIEKLIINEKKVISYPFINYWLDIGKHQDFIKAQSDINHILV